MKTAILFASKHGTTEKVARRIACLLNEEGTEIINLKSIPSPDLSAVDRVVIGASIHMGKIPKRVSDFLKTHETELLEKPLGLFLCCLYEGEVAKRQLKEAFLETLRNQAVTIQMVGGELLFDEMNFLERALARKAMGTQPASLGIDELKLMTLVSDLKRSSEIVGTTRLITT